MRYRRRAELDGQVAQAYNARKGRSGASRLCHDLREVGLPCNRKTVAASMQRQGLRAKAAKKFKATTNSQHSLPHPSLAMQHERQRQLLRQCLCRELPPQSEGRVHPRRALHEPCPDA